MIKANCLSLGIGSVSILDPKEASLFILKYFPDIPFWPQLPKTGFKNNMYVQFSEGLPGLIIDEQNQKMHIDTNKFMENMESFLETYLKQNPDDFKISEEYAQGLYAFLQHKEKEINLSQIRAIKGQVTGPISFGMQVVDENKKCIAYNDCIREVLVKLLQMKAKWQESKLKELNNNTIIFLDEPYLTAFGSAYFSLDKETVTGMLNEVLSGINGLKGIHCCGNTDWSLILNSPINILSFDAFNFSDNLNLFVDQVIEFLNKDKIIAWGIVPTNAEDIKKVNKDILLQKFDNCLQKLIDKGLQKEFILERSFITPSCGVGSESIETAKNVFELTKELSNYLRKENELE